MSDLEFQSPELGSSPSASSSIPRVDNNGSLGADDNNETADESPLQQAHQREVDSEEVRVYSRRQRPPTDAGQAASTHLGKRERDAAGTSRDPKPGDDSILGKLNAIVAAVSTSQAAKSAARLSSQQAVVGGAGGANETQHQQCPPRQAKDHIHRERVRPVSQDGNETSHRWLFGAVAELLDNAVDEIPNGATRVLIDSVVTPRNGSPSLLVQDDGGGMNPISLWKCMTSACPNKKPPDSIGQNGTGFKAAVSCLGAGAIIFTRHVHTGTPTQSIGLRSLSGEETDRKRIVVPMVNYKYDPVTAEIRRCERNPGQFCTNMSTLLKLSPYNSEEELLQNFNDIGPHGTKIIVFNLSRDAKGDLDLHFNTDAKDIRISAATMRAENKAVWDQDHVVYQYRRSLRAYVSILYMGLPVHFKIILRGEEVKRRNLVTELKHSQHIRYRCSATEREDEVVLGFLDDAPDFDTDRFCLYYKQRLILPFVPAYGFSDRSRSIVGVLQPNHLTPARNKQDFQWSSELGELQKILMEMGEEFWKRLKGKELKDAAALLSLAPPGPPHDEANLIWSNAAGMHSQMTPPAPAHLVAPILESSYGVPAPSYMVPRTPDPCLPLFPVTPTGEGQKKRVMATADPWDQGSTSNGVPAHRPSSTLAFGWSNGGSSSHGTQRAPAAPHLPTSAMASMAGRWPTMPAVASTNGYGMNINRASASIAPWPAPAYLAPPFSQPNSSGMGPNGVMRAPAPHLAAHLAAIYMPAAPGFRRWSTPASSVTGAALPLPATQATAANTIGGLAPSYSVPAGAMVAHRGLPIRMEYAGAYHDTATLLALGVPAAAAGAAATSSVPAPAVVDTGDGGGASAFNPWCPRGFEPDDGPSSSSRQAQELQGGSNQGEQRTRPLLDLFKR